MASGTYQYCKPAALLETVGGMRPIFLQLFDIFRRDGAAKLAAMRAAVEQNDLAQLGFHAHALKGTVGPVGADALMDELIRMEEDCKQRQTSCDAQKLDDVARQIAQIEQELEHFVAHSLAS